MSDVGSHAAPCEVCRDGWDRGERPWLVLRSMDRQALVYRCEACGTFWEMTERLARPMEPGEVATWGGDLSQAIVRYVGHGESPYPRERPESVAQAFGPRSSGLIDDEAVRALAWAWSYGDR